MIPGYANPKVSVRTVLGVFVAAALAAQLAGAEAAELYVASEGNDAWSGTLAKPNADKSDGPVASLAGARDALRKLRAAKSAEGAVRVLVAAGRYSMTEPLTLQSQDGGTKDAPVTYEAAPGARPVTPSQAGSQVRMACGPSRSPTLRPASGTSSSSS